MQRPSESNVKSPPLSEPPGHSKVLTAYVFYKNGVIVSAEEEEEAFAPKFGREYLKKQEAVQKSTKAVERKVEKSSKES